MRKSGVLDVLRKVAQGLLLSVGVLVVFFALNKDTILADFFLYETMPNYEMQTAMRAVFNVGQDVDEGVAAAPEAAPDSNEAAPVFYDTGAELSVSEPEGDLLGLGDVIFQPETDYGDFYDHFGENDDFSIDDVDALRDLSYLKNRFYTVDKRTDLSPEQFNIDDFLTADLTIDTTVPGPKILIFHTHSSEKYVDSGPDGGVVGFGNSLADALLTRYGIESIHNTDAFDRLNGESHVMGAYERMEPVIKKILAENPSIQVAIDIHRDGVSGTTRLVEYADNKPTAQLMFFNGLSKLYDNGALKDIESLPNPNVRANLAMSFNMQLAANTLYPGLTRKIYLNAYRYSLHMLPKSLLVEVGAQTNTEEEAQNAVEPLADILAHVILKKNPAE